MANPQIENGYIRIANELWDEILRRDFSKRQQNIILLLWRLSYGCGQKDCQVPKFNVFEIAGIYKADIKKELKYLRSCRVIEWDEEKMVFSINKNYEVWQISPNKNWDEEKLKSIVSSNLKRKKEVSKTLTKEQEKVSETLTGELVKHEPEHTSNPCGSKDEEGSKYNIKNNIKNNKDYLLVVGDKPNPFIFWETNGFGTISSFLTDNINYWLDGNFFDEPEEVLIRAMQEAVLHNARTWKYIEGTLINWEKEKLRTVRDIEAHIAAYKAKKTGGGTGARNREGSPGHFDKSEYFSL